MRKVMIRSGVSPFDSYSVNDYLDHDPGGGIVVISCLHPRSFDC